jgi:hypothetical protein
MSASRKTAYEIARHAACTAQEAAGFHWDGCTYNENREIETEHWNRGLERVSVSIAVKERP